MKRIPQESAMFGNFAAGCALSAVVIGAFIALVENPARATEPPDPPPQ
ncbi:MAG: hypothetical protein KF886_16155 [Candidatus Hydrogenedentes bacterium]|nr:hypothetical protein [Candidatus Hydrogenedentota bacterium]